MLANMPMNPGGRSTGDTLSQVGIARHQSSRWHSRTMRMLLIVGNGPQHSITNQDQRGPGTWLTAREIRDLVGVALSTPYRWGAAGLLPTLRIGGTVRFQLPAAAIPATDDTGDDEK